jgi:hypothetical protein
LTSALDGGEWGHCCCYPLDRRLGGPHNQAGCYGEEKKSLAPARNQNPCWDKSTKYVKVGSKYNQTIPKRWQKGIIIYKYEVNLQNKGAKFELNL